MWNYSLAVGVHTTNLNYTEYCTYKHPVHTHLGSAARGISIVFLFLFGFTGRSRCGKLSWGVLIIFASVTFDFSNRMGQWRVA